MVGARMRVVIPSVNYADFLATTLPAWRALLPKARIIVVTSPDDAQTPELARRHGAEACITDAWGLDLDGSPAKGRKAFNKARALDEAFGIRPGYTDPPAIKEYCLSIDADVYPAGQWSTEEAKRSDTLYGCARYRCRSPEELEAHVSGARPREALEIIPPRLRGEDPASGSRLTIEEAGTKGLGYFQLFRFQPHRAFGNSKTAGKYDLEFARSFERRKGLTAFYVLHLGGLDRRNWSGRVVPEWRGAP